MTLGWNRPPTCWMSGNVLMLSRNRITESLKGPAADIVRGLRATNLSATANEYIKTLDTAFGTTDSAADLMVRFRNTFQQETAAVKASFIYCILFCVCYFQKMINGW